MPCVQAERLHSYDERTARKPFKICGEQGSVVGTKTMMPAPTDASCDATSCCGAEIDTSKCGEHMTKNQLPRVKHSCVQVLPEHHQQNKEQEWPHLILVRPAPLQL